MFHRGSFFLRLLAFFLFVAVLFAGGILIYQAGQAQGYALGAAAAGGEITAPPASVPTFPGYYPYMRPHYGFFPFPFFGLLCMAGLALLFFPVIGSFFFRHAWGHPHWGHDPQAWKDWQSGRWGPPPWVKQDQAGETGAEARPPSGGPQAGGPQQDAAGQ